MSWLTIDNVRNKHKNIPAICIGHGPSLNNYISKLDKLKKNHILFGSNSWYDFYKTFPNYWITCGALENNLKNQYDNLIKYKSITYCFSETFDTNNYKDYNMSIFDCLLYNSYPNDSNPEDKSIQKELKKITNVDKRYGIGCNTGLHVITLSILMGCNPIYLIGFDINYNLGYANTKNTIHNMNLKNAPETIKQDYINNYLYDLTTINVSAKNIGVEIINLNKDSFFDIFKLGEIK